MSIKSLKRFNLALKTGLILLSLTLASSVFALGASGLYPVENKDYFLNDIGSAEKDSNDKGCHAQGIKFDGQNYYFTCMDTNGKHASYLYVHDDRGRLIKEFTQGSEFQHPSGILLYKGWAYTGFTHAGFLNLSYDSELWRFNGQGKVEYQGWFDHSVGFVGANFPDMYNPELNLKTLYASYTQYYLRKCKSTAGSCNRYRNVTTGKTVGPVTKLSDSVQDCDHYYKNGAWYKACILFSADENKIRVWKANQTVLSKDNALKTLVMDGQPGHSGGLGFYTDPNGTKWVVTSPPPATDSNCGRRACGGCGLVGKNVCACTDKNNRQRVRFYRFANFNWPG